MTVEAKVAFIKHAGNGTASPLAVPFRFLEASHLIVTALTDGAAQILVRGTHYNVAGAGAAAGGTVTPTAPVPIGTSWTISRRTPRSQPTKYDDGFYSAKAQETGLDRQALALQEIGDDVDRAPKLPVEGGAEGQYPIVLGDGSWGFSVGSGGGGAATNVRATITAEVDGQTEFDFSTVLSDTVRAAMNAAGTLPWFSAQGVPLEEDDYSWSQSTWTLTIPDGVKAGEIIGLTNGASYDQGLVEGRNVIGLREGGPGKGVNLVGTKYPLASTAARVLGDSLSDRMPSIWDFFRPDLGDTLDDWSPQLNRAAQSDHDIYIPTARRPQGYDLLGPVTQNEGGQMYYGDATGTGAGSGSEFNIPATFPLGGNGVIIIPPNTSERGAGIADIGFRFAQPDTAVRANLIQYPPAVYARGVARMRLLGRNTVYLGWEGFDLLGNAGGLEIGHLRLGCFSKGLALDGAYDKISAGSIEVWPYGCGGDGESAGLYSIYRDGVGLGLDIGRVDGFSASLIATFQQRIRFHAAEGEMPGSDGFGTIAQLHLDGTYGRLEMEGSKWAVGSWYASTGIGDDYYIRQTGGVLALGPATFTLGAGTPTGQDLIQVTGGKFSHQGGGVHYSVPFNAALLRQTGGTVEWFGGECVGKDHPRTQAYFYTSGGRLTLKNPRFDEVGAGSGETLKITNDEWHDIEINASLSRGHTIPGGTVNGTYKFGSTVIAPALG